MRMGIRSGALLQSQEKMSRAPYYSLLFYPPTPHMGGSINPFVFPPNLNSPLPKTLPQEGGPKMQLITT